MAQRNSSAREMTDIATMESVREKLADALVANERVSLSVDEIALVLEAVDAKESATFVDGYRAVYDHKDDGLTFGIRMQNSPTFSRAVHQAREDRAYNPKRLRDIAMGVER